jgi:hypothetical protein
MSSLLDRIGAFFLEPRRDPSTPEPVPERTPPLGLAPSSDRDTAGFAPRAASLGSEATRIESQRAASLDSEASPTDELPAFAAVLGAPGVTLPVAAACAGELRVRQRAAAAVLCVWGGGEAPAGATTPAVRRVAARMETAGLAASACGRLAWVALDPDPEAAVAQAQRARERSLVPVVLTIAGVRPFAFEALLDEVDVAIAVLPAEADEALRALARWSLPAPESLILPPLPPGPPRWAAMAGLARLRSMKGGTA